MTTTEAPTSKTTREYFRDVMRDRRHATGADRAYLTRTARKLFWIMRGVPTIEWTKLERQYDQ